MIRAALTTIVTAMVLILSADVRAQTVQVVPLEGSVGPASVDLVIRTIQQADPSVVQAVVIRMDTPGGLDKSMRDLVKVILASRVPVITYVAPNGARAASAGTYIATASHIAAMAPATNIGSSTPVSLAPSTPSPRPSLPDDEPPAADAMTNKVVNDAVAYLKGLAELRGRNTEWAEQTVREGANLPASEALAAGVVDVIAESLQALLVEIDGRELEVDGRTVTLATASAEIELVEVDWRHEILGIVTDPSIAYGLLIIGIYGLILEFYNPGMIFPAVLGVICILLGAYGLQMLPINYAGVALLLIGMGLIVAEVVTPTYGVLGLGGVAAFVIGSVLLFDSDVTGFDVPYGLIAAFAVSTAGLAFFVVGAALRARHQPVVTGVRAMIGAPAIALEDFDREGTVRAFGEIWQARADQPVRSGQTLEITEVDDLTLKVQLKEQS